MKTMQQWQMDDVGLAHLNLKSTAIPSPKAGEVLVKTSAVSLNYRDKVVIDNGMGMPLNFPLIPGSDLAGVIVEVGENVRRFNKGDRVISTFAPDWLNGTPPGSARNPFYASLGGNYPGVLAEYVVFNENWLVAAPKTLSDVEASTLPCAALTAWFALVEKGNLIAGEKVLVEGTGGVALFGLQIAKALGAEVFVVTSSAEKIARVKNLGADFVIDRSKEDWVNAVWRLTNDYGVDHILELVGGSHIDKAVQAAAIGGKIYQIGMFEGLDISFSGAPFMLKNLNLYGIGVGHRDALENMIESFDKINIKPIIDSVYDFCDLPNALKHFAERPFGKIVIKNT